MLVLCRKKALTGENMLLVQRTSVIYDGAFCGGDFEMKSLVSSWQI